MWTSVPHGEAVIRGVKYRSIYYLKMPYSDNKASMFTRTVIAARPAASLFGYWLESAEAFPPSMTTQTPGSRYQRWRVVVEWRKT